jgi:Asp-tRNA(Asn)/Glu-tRNA(Gln) amidotransferase A subunit family amidase
MDEQCFGPFVSARQIAAAVRAGSLDPVDVAESALQRIEALDRELNAFTVVLADEALKDARRLSASRLAGPLAGVPVAVKDHVWMAGAPATNGSRALADFVPDVDCVAVARLRAAGAVIVGKTNNPEFCYRGHTDSPVYGVTRNPFDLTRTPGGSSGGSAAAVSAGLVPLAVGTDGGGSIRAPSAFCGIVGHKPTFGLVPTRPGFQGWPTLSVHGPIGRNLADVATMLSVMAGPHPADPSTVPVDCEALAAAPGSRPDLGGLRVVVSEDFGFAKLDTDIREIFGRATAALESLGCELVERETPGGDPIGMWYEIAAAESFASEGHLLSRAAGLTEYSLGMLQRGEAMSAGQYLEAQERRRALVRAWGELFDQVDLVISPGKVIPPPTIEAAQADDDEGWWWGMDAIANLTGQPSLALPCGLTPTGLPVGLQVLGRRHFDPTVLAAAAVLEEVLPHPVPPPPFGPDERSP